MATITYTTRLGKYGELTDFYNPNKIVLDSGNSERVTFVDKQGGEQIILRGDHLTVNKNGVVTGGTIDAIDFKDSHGIAFMKVTDFEVTAKSVAATLKNHGVDGLLDLALSGKDTLIGSLTGDQMYGGPGKDVIKGGAGLDHIEGGTGADRLTGGKASDHFIFHTGDGKDVITDFDAKGGGDAQDYIVTNDHTFEITGQGSNTLIDFGGGDTITLLGVKHTDVTVADFIF